MSNPDWYVFAGGGTGGHLFPAMSVAEALRASDAACEVAFFCTQRPIDRDILSKADIPTVPQVVRAFPAKPWRWPGFLLAWRQAVADCTRRFRARRPAVVVGAGGYASGPPVHAAAKLGIPTFLLNPDAVPGRANRHMAAKARVQCVFAQWEATRRHLSPSVRVEVTGCPVRASFRQAASLAPGPMRESFGLQGDTPTLLVTGASQGARTINEACVRLAGAMAEAGWQVLHLSGPSDVERVERAYAAVGGLRHRVLAFTDRMAEAMAAADVIVSRAGASTLSEIQAVGRASILLPYPYGDQHQRHNAAVLSEAGAAVCLEDTKEAVSNAAQLGSVLAELAADAPRRSAMGQAARSLDRPDSAGAIASVLLRSGAANV